MYISESLPATIPLPILLCPTTSMGSPFFATPRSTRPVTIVPLSIKTKESMKYLFLYIPYLELNKHVQ